MLGITEETTRVHLRNIFAKLGTRDRTAAVHVALRRGILHIGLMRAPRARREFAARNFGVASSRRVFIRVGGPNGDGHGPSGT